MEFSQQEFAQFATERMNLLMAQNLALTEAVNAIRLVLTANGGFGAIDMKELLEVQAATADKQAAETEEVGTPEKLALAAVWRKKAEHLRQMASFGSTEETKASPAFQVIEGGKGD